MKRKRQDNPKPVSRGTHREAHRAFRHFCITGLLLSSIATSMEAIPQAYDIWLLPGIAVGMGFSWLTRKRKLLLWHRLMTFVLIGQTGFWAWTSFQGQLPPIEAVCAAMSGIAFFGSFVANGKLIYRYFKVLSVGFLMIGGWMGTCELYPQFLAASLGFVLFAILCGRSSPAGIAEIYVDTQFPGFERTIGAGLFFVAAAAFATYPIYLALPRLSPEKRQVLKSILPVHNFAYRPSAKKSTFGKGKNGGRGVEVKPLSVSSQRVSLSPQSPPNLKNTTLFIVRGPRMLPWRSKVLDVYDGESWTTRGADSVRPLPTRRAEGAAMLRREDGACYSTEIPHEYTVSVQDEIGQNLLRPYGANEIIVPDHDLYRDGYGNIIVDPPLAPPFSYQVRTPSGVEIRRRTNRKVDPAYLEVPAAIPERVRELVWSLTRKQSTWRGKVYALREFIRKRCHYSLQDFRLPEGREATDFFLFDARHGWCVHFASSLVVMCRIAGVPARLVVGYGPGQMDPLTRTHYIAEKDAHAWMEVYSSVEGWVEWDPTPEDISPLRRQGGGLSSIELGLTGAKASFDRGMMRLKIWHWKMKREVDRQPLWFLVPPGVLLGLFIIFKIVKTRQRRELIRNLWEDIHEAPPRTSVRAAYALAAAHLERRGFGKAEYTSPGEFFQRLEAINHPAADSMGRIVTKYETSAYGPHLSMRWNRKELIDDCKAVMSKVGRRGLLKFRRFAND